MRLVRALHVVRGHLLRLRIRPTQTLWQPVLVMAMGLGIGNLCAILLMPTLSNALLECVLPFLMTYAILTMMSIIYAMQAPFGTPHTTLIHVSMEPLFYLRQRLHVKTEEIRARMPSS